MFNNEKKIITRILETYYHFITFPLFVLKIAKLSKNIAQWEEWEIRWLAYTYNDEQVRHDD